MRISYLQKKIEYGMSCTTYTESVTVSSHMVRVASARPLTAATPAIWVLTQHLTQHCQQQAAAQEIANCLATFPSAQDMSVIRLSVISYYNNILQKQYLKTFSVQAAAQGTANNLSTYPAAQDMSVNPSTLSYPSTLP